MSPDRTASLAHFAFMPLPNFTMIAFTNAIEVLRMANYLSGQQLYRWSIISPDGGPSAADALASLVAITGTHTLAPPSANRERRHADPCRPRR